MPNRPNNYAFIDSQNLNLGVQSQGWVLDFKRFRVFLKDKYHVAKAFLFIGYVVGNEGLYTTLQQFGYICIFKPTLEVKINGENKTKGNVDADLVLHAMIQLVNYEKAVIVTGDGDFHCLVEYLSEQEKLAKIIVPNLHYSSLLRKFSNFIVNVQFFRVKLEKNKKRPQAGQNPSRTF
ncbi:MAG: NYN domain-containing protein [Candidatus Magasanikbacteria bacterium]|nr:NYN domain-containing protein [Candidatus Magasanikbacteria bacterium]